MKKEEGKQILDELTETGLIDEETREEINSDIDAYLAEKIMRNNSIIEQLKQKRQSLGLPLLFSEEEIKLRLA